MKVRALLSLCCTIITIQVIHAAPPSAVPFEVNASTGNVGVENPLIQGATAGDLMLKTPEPLTTTTMSGSGSGSVSSTGTDGSGSVSFSTGSNDVTDVGDHILPTITTAAGNFLNGNPTASSSSTSSSFTGEPAASSTIAATSSPFDGQITAASSGPATTTGLTVADPLLVYKMITNMLRRQEQLMQSMNFPLSGMWSGSLPSMRIRMPNIQIPNPTNDPSLKLVDEQKINEGDLEGEIKTYEGRPDPNTITKMQTSRFNVNKDGLQGSGSGQHYISSSSSSSSSSGDNPVASVGTFFGGIPSRLGMGFPAIGLRFT